ncbi:MAG: hypothetical protein QXZ44_06375 [Ferroplasma sp.]
MADSIYIYNKRVIIGPSNYKVEISKYKNKTITISGDLALEIKKYDKKFIIFDGLIELGYVLPGGIMNYENREFRIDKAGIKALKSGKINFMIITDGVEVAYINAFRDNLNIRIENCQYINTAIIYLAILSHKIKLWLKKFRLMPPSSIAIFILSPLFSALFSGLFTSALLANQNLTVIEEYTIAIVAIFAVITLMLEIFNKPFK